MPWADPANLYEKTPVYGSWNVGATSWPVWDASKDYNGGLPAKSVVKKAPGVPNVPKFGPEMSGVEVATNEVEDPVLEVTLKNSDGYGIEGVEEADITFDTFDNETDLSNATKFTLAEIGGGVYTVTVLGAGLVGGWGEKTMENFTYDEEVFEASVTFTTEEP